MEYRNLGKTGLKVSPLCLGAMMFGQWGNPDHGESVRILHQALDSGINFVDTANNYSAGESEEIVGKALQGRRNDVVLATKVWAPMGEGANQRGLSRKAIEEQLDASLKRLGTDRLDLYLLHWRGSVPLNETLHGFRALKDSGLIRHWGVSNFDLDDLQELADLTSETEIAANQVLYNLGRRGIEYDLMPWCRERGLPIIAYSPIEQGRLTTHAAVEQVAARQGVTSAEVALAWVLRQPGVIAIPKAADPDHVAANRRALDLRLSADDLAELDRAFPPPSTPQPLEML